MKLDLLLFSFVMAIFASFANGQDLITFDNQGWNNNQTLSTNITSGNYSFSSNNKFYTNYGNNFNINENSIYYVFQNPSTDNITIKTKDNSLTTFISVEVYQVC